MFSFYLPSLIPSSLSVSLSPPLSVCEVGTIPELPGQVCQPGSEMGSGGSPGRGETQGLPASLATPHFDATLYDKLIN